MAKKRRPKSIAGYSFTRICSERLLAYRGQKSVIRLRSLSRCYGEIGWVIVRRWKVCLDLLLLVFWIIYVLCDSTLPPMPIAANALGAGVTIPLGIAKGAEVPYLSILAMNVRTEIAYGMSKDGCTALYWRNLSSTFLAQNWDWQEEQQENLISIQIHRENKPTVAMITEAGIIGKIGLNSSGVGVCLNAVRAIGVDFERLPCHLALRTCLESNSVQEAVAALEKAGVASACHILVGDQYEAAGVECSHLTVIGLPTKEVLTHTNHYIGTHPVEDRMALKDSRRRLERIDEIIRERMEKVGVLRDVKAKDIRVLLADERDAPTAICRSRTEDSSVATLFSIVMDLRERRAEVVVGKPSQWEAEVLVLDPVML